MWVASGADDISLSSFGTLTLCTFTAMLLCLYGSQLYLEQGWRHCLQVSRGGSKRCLVLEG
jgi:hypothetical protein